MTTYLYVTRSLRSQLVSALVLGQNPPRTIWVAVRGDKARAGDKWELGQLLTPVFYRVILASVEKLPGGEATAEFIDRWIEIGRFAQSQGWLEKGGAAEKVTVVEVKNHQEGRGVCTAEQVWGVEMAAKVAGWWK